MNTSFLPEAARARSHGSGRRHPAGPTSGWPVTARCHSWRLGGGILAGVLLAWAGLVPATAAVFNSNFSTDPGGLAVGHAKVDNGILKINDLQEYIDGTSGLPLHGSYILPDFNNGQKIAGFSATFNASIHGGTETPAQGFSLVLANDIPTDVPFREGGGNTHGLTLSFDTVDNQAGFEAEGNDPGDAPGIILKFGGRKVAAKKFSGLRTGPANDQTPHFVPVQITLTEDGTLDVSYNGVKVYDKFTFGYAPLAGQFAFGAGTAELTAAIRANHWIDDLAITTTPVSGAYILSALPLAQGALPDAVVKIDIQDLSGGAVALTFDGASVTPQTSTAGAVTTVTYDPPGFLLPNSSHTVKLTYGAKTLNYGFTVVNYVTLGTNDMAAAGSVDTTKSGFKLKVYQTETTSISNNRLAEKVIAGQGGANIANLSGATGGLFDVDPVLNYDRDGLDNDIAGDIAFPGIPGTKLDGSPSTDNFAVEAIAYLDLPSGAYSFGVNSDDGFKLTAASNPRDVTGAQITAWDATRGPADSVGAFAVTQSGIYPFRLLYWQQGGGAALEWFVVDADGTRYLINDTGAPAGKRIRSYRQLTAGASLPPYVSAATPAPGDVNVSVAPKITIDVTDETATVTQSSIQLYLNGALVTLPAGAVTKINNVTTIAYQVVGALAAQVDQTVRLEFNDSTGRHVTRQWSFTTGTAAGGALANAVKGQWDFDSGDLRATVGRELHLIDDSLIGRYQFGTTTGFGIPDINGKPARVLYVPYTDTTETDATGAIFKRIGLRMQHSMPPNGGGTKVNQWTLIMDVYWGANGPSGFGSILQTHDLANPTDGDMFWRASDGYYGKGCCSIYDGIPGVSGPGQARGTWARVVFSVDLAGTTRKLAKYINGQKHREDLTGDGNALDSRFGLPPEIFLFGDGDDNERTDCYINSIQIRDVAMSDDEVAALGGPSADGIPLQFSQWDFDNGTLAATVGHDMHTIDDSLLGRYQFGTTTQFGVPDINGRPAKVLYIPYTDTTEADGTGPIFKRIGLRVDHGLGANGGGTKLNQYTLIMDVLWGVNGPAGFGSILQTHDLANPTDGDMFWRASDGYYGKGCCSIYDGIPGVSGPGQPRGTWARVVFSVDLAGTTRKLAKYINGQKHREDLTGDGNALDSRFGLPPEIFLFGDGDDNERTDCYVNSIQIRAGAMTDDQVAALGAASADGIPTPNPVKGEWNFDNGTLAATVGHDLHYIDDGLASRYQFGITTQLGIPDIAGKAAKVLWVPYTDTTDADATGPVFKRIGLRTDHGIGPNGGGTKANQWTWIMDVFWGVNGPSGFGSILQTHDLANPTDGDMFWRASDGYYGKGCCSIYDGIAGVSGPGQARGEWARVVFVADLASTPRRLAKFINGQKHREDLTGDGNALDSRFALPPQIFLFGDGDDNERTECYVNAIQFREGALSDQEVAALGGPSAYGIPAAPGSSAPVTTPVAPTLVVGHSGNNLSITLTGGRGTLTLQRRADLNPGTQWVDVGPVSGASLTVTNAFTGPQGYYRIKAQ